MALATVVTAVATIMTAVATVATTEGHSDGVTCVMTDMMAVATTVMVVVTVLTTVATAIPVHFLAIVMIPPLRQP